MVKIWDREIPAIQAEIKTMVEKLVAEHGVSEAFEKLITKLIESCDEYEEFASGEMPSLDYGDEGIEEAAGDYPQYQFYLGDGTSQLWINIFCDNASIHVHAFNMIDMH